VISLGIKRGFICPYTERPAVEDTHTCDGCPNSQCLNEFGRWILRVRWRLGI
jgi:hypothetical protein